MSGGKHCTGQAGEADTDTNWVVMQEDSSAGRKGKRGTVKVKAKAEVEVEEKEDALQEKWEVQKHTL